MTIVTTTFFFFNDTATTEIYTLSLHDALPIYQFLRRFDLRQQILYLEQDLVLERFIQDRKSTRLNSSHSQISYAVFCLKKKKMAHACPRPLPRLEVATISKRAKPLSMKVRMKSTRPSSIKDCVCRSPVASVNSLAMTAAMEYPGEKREALMMGVLPMTMVTAIVSPRARARARKTEPKMPAQAKGTTTFHVDSQRVAPRERAASRWSRGTERSTSRETEMI